MIAYVFFKVTFKFWIQTIQNFAVIYPWNLLFPQKVAYSLIASIALSVYKWNFTARWFKNQKAMNVKISVFGIRVEAIYFLLDNLLDCTFNKTVSQ